MSNPRILAIPSPFAYVNPTWDVLLTALAHYHDCLIVGPKTRVPCDSIGRLALDQGPFDCILCDPWFFFQAKDIPVQYRANDLLDCGIPIVLNLLQYDLHSLSERFVEQVKAASALAISAATSPQFRMPMDDAYAREAWLDPTGHSNIDANAIDDHFALMPHCLGVEEFSVGQVRRRHDVSVLGAKYHFRRAAVAYLEERGIRPRRADNYQKILGFLATRFPFANKTWPINRPPGIGLYRWRYRRSIASSNISVTCDGSIGYPVRKFFEIPALGAVLAAQFFPNPEALCFRDEETAFMLDEGNLERLVDIIESARRNAPEIENVRRRGTEMVRQLHTAKVRAGQLNTLLAEIAQGRRVTTRWVDGQQQIVPRAVEVGQDQR